MTKTYLNLGAASRLNIEAIYFMKLTDFIAQYLVNVGIRHAFVLQGGAALHLIDSIEKNKDIESIPMQHEQACAMAADGYASVRGSIGCTIVTSGPGATNLLTGMACSYFDSIATIHICGNVASFRQSDHLGVRQYGFQETDIVSIAKPICKYVVRISSPESIINELPKAISIALSGRKGPVLVDIPDDFQRVELDNQVVESAFAAGLNFNHIYRKIKLEDVKKLVTKLSKACRPIVILGAGVDSANKRVEAVAFCRRFNLPFLTTWPLKGCSDHNEALNLGSFGTHSLRGNNIVLQNASYILSVGCRLDSRATAKLDSFAREAHISMIDIDGGEIEKFAILGLELDICLQGNCKDFFALVDVLPVIDIVFKGRSRDDWLKYIRKVRNQFNYLPIYELDMVNPYLAVELISQYIHENAVIVADTGTCLPLSLVYMQEKLGQRYVSSYNNTPMGYGLPAAIGASLVNGSDSPVLLMTGDGGLQMNIQELATLAKLNLPVTIIVFNNDGHCMIKQTQDDWLQSKYCASSVELGLPHINFTNVATAYGITAHRVESNEQLNRLMEREYNEATPRLIELMINSGFRYEPIIKYGNPLENMNPLISSDMVQEAMLITAY